MDGWFSRVVFVNERSLLQGNIFAIILLSNPPFFEQTSKQRRKDIEGRCVCREPCKLKSMTIQPITAADGLGANCPPVYAVVEG